MEKEGLGDTSLWWIGIENLRTYSLLLVLELYRLNSRASTNSHLSTVDYKTDPFSCASGQCTGDRAGIQTGQRRPKGGGGGGVRFQIRSVCLLTSSPPVAVC